MWNVRSSEMIVKMNYHTQGLQNKNVPNNRAEYMKCFCKTGDQNMLGDLWTIYSSFTA